MCGITALKPVSHNRVHVNHEVAWRCHRGGRGCGCPRELSPHLLSFLKKLRPCFTLSQPPPCWQRWEVAGEPQKPENCRELPTSHPRVPPQLSLSDRRNKPIFHAPGPRESQLGARTGSHIHAVQPWGCMAALSSRQGFRQPRLYV